MCAFVGFLASNSSVSLAQADKTPSVSPPKVSEPVRPKETDASPKELSPAPTWESGEPVRVVPDLKESTTPGEKAPSPKKNDGGASSSRCPGASERHLPKKKKSSGP